MIFAISKLISAVTGFDISKVQRYVVIGVFILIALLLLFVALKIKSCNDKRHAKIDQESIQKINDANEAKRTAELTKVITENAEVIKTIDERNTISEVNEAEKQVQIYAKVKEADRKIMEAKKQGRDVTGPELECILVPEGCQ